MRKNPGAGEQMGQAKLWRRTIAFAALVIVFALSMGVRFWLTGRMSQFISLSILFALSATAIFAGGAWFVTREKHRRYWESGGRGLAVLTLILFVFGMMLTLVSAFRTYETIVRNKQAQFDKLADHVEDAFGARLNSIVLGLRSFSGLFAASDSVESEQFTACCKAVDIQKSFPYAHAFGYIEKVPRQRLEEYVQTRQLDGAPWFHVKTEGTPSTLYVLSYSEPIENSISSIGKDLAVNPVKRAAMEEAARTGEPTLTPPLQLAVEDTTRAGFLYLMPVYAHGAALQTPEQRLNNVNGFVCARLLSSELFGNLTGDNGEPIDLDIYEGQTNDPKHLIFDSSPENREAPGTEQYCEHRHLKIGKVILTIEVRAMSSFIAGISYIPAFGVLAVGTILTLLASGGFWLISNRRADAERVAEKMTEDLRKQSHVLAAAEQQMRSIVNNVPGMTYRCEGIDGWYLTFVSDAVESVTGYTVDEVRFNASRSFAEIIHPEDLPMVNANADRAIESRQPYEIEYRIVRKDGTTRWVRERGRPLYNETGEFCSLDGVLVDVTESHLAQEALRQAKDVAEAASRAKGQFLANMSHEIRTPLTAILGFADVIEGESDPATRSDAVSTIRRNGTHLLALISDILDLTKIEAGMLTVSMDEMNPLACGREVLSLLDLRAKERGIALHLKIDENTPRAMHCDPVRFRQILMNLVGNAIKFTERGSVTIRMRAQRSPTTQDRLVVDVIDSGIGISAEALPRLFGDFEQGDPSMSRRFGGTGLGLSISRRLAHLLGGDLTVVSEQARGSTFTLDLPIVVPPGRVAQNRAPIATPAEPVGKDRPLHGMRILLGEDGKDNQRLLRHFLERAGATVSICNDGLEVVHAMTVAGDLDSPLHDPCPFDVILLDLYMPEMDGLACALKLRLRGCQAPILAVTAQMMAQTIRDCRNIGFDEIIAKPIDRSVLINTVARFSPANRSQPGESPVAAVVHSN